jgi:hypothetical protein
MTPAHSARNKTRRYRYYVCCNAQKRGWGVCPSKAVSAAEIKARVSLTGLPNPELAPATFPKPAGQRHGEDQVVIGALA